LLETGRAVLNCNVGREVGEADKAGETFHRARAGIEIQVTPND